MEKTHYEKAYDREYQQCKKLIAFIESLESTTNDWDDLCDCLASEQPVNHCDDCRTMNIRNDYHKLFKRPDLNSKAPSKDGGA